MRDTEKTERVAALERQVSILALETRAYLEMIRAIYHLQPPAVQKDLNFISEGLQRKIDHVNR